MTTTLVAAEVAAQINQKFAGMAIEANQNTILVKSDAIRDILVLLKNTPGLEFDYLNDITAVDYWDYFELVYQLTSIQRNHRVTIKTRLNGRENLSLPSSVSVYKGADLQEREIFDLMGIKFEGHPNSKRILLWEGFNGHPLRKDYL